MKTNYALMALGFACAGAALACGAQGHAPVEEKTESVVPSVAPLTTAEASSTAQTAVTLALMNMPIVSELLPDEAGNVLAKVADHIYYDRCPRVVVEQVEPRHPVVRLFFPAEDSCEDLFGNSQRGEIAFKREGRRHWSATFKSYVSDEKTTMDGRISLRALRGGVWNIDIDNFSVTTTQRGSKSDPECQQPCASMVTWDLGINMTLATVRGYPLIANVNRDTDKVSLLGDVYVSGAAAGRIAGTWKQPGNDEPFEQVINVSFGRHVVNITSLTYDLPPTCTCPESGGVSTAAFMGDGCGTAVVSFDSRGQTWCPVATLRYENDGVRQCKQRAAVGTAFVQSLCKPAKNYKKPVVKLPNFRDE